MRKKLSLDLELIEVPYFPMILGIFLKSFFSLTGKVKLIFQIVPDFQVEWEP